MNMLAIRTAAVVAAVALSAPANSQSMAGFPEIAAKGQQLDLRVPNWMKGRLKSGAGLTGAVRRQSLGNSEAVRLFGVILGGAERFGRFTFDVEGSAIDGALAADCIYDRTERRIGVGGLAISQPLRPLLLRCRFIRAGQVVGGLELEAAPRTGALIQPAARIGHAEILGTRIAIASEHYLQGARFATDQPVGYRFAEAGRDIGAVDLTQFNRRAVVAPVNGSARLISIAAGTALAVFWDPGDTDD